MTKRELRAKWIVDNKGQIETARKSISCPVNCKAKCGNGLTCKTSSSGGWGYWVQAFRLAGVSCEPMRFWHGSLPTPSTSINKAIADFISSNAPDNLR